MPLVTDPETLNRLNKPDTKVTDPDILKQLNIKKDVYNKKSGVNTCMFIDGEVINYHCDVELAINCCLENRDKNIIEWD